MASHFKVNGTYIKSPSTFKIERYLVTNLERLANADMVGDLIAKKLKFYFTYESLTGEDLATILGAIWDSGTIFYELEYHDDDGSAHTVTVYSGSIPSELHKASKNWVWKNVTFDLIQK